MRHENSQWKGFLEPARRASDTQLFSLRQEVTIVAAIPLFPCDRQNRWGFSPKGQLSRQQELVAWCIGLQGQVWMQNIKNPSLQKRIRARVWISGTSGANTCLGLGGSIYPKLQRAMLRAKAGVVTQSSCTGWAAWLGSTL